MCSKPPNALLYTKNTSSGGASGIYKIRIEVYPQNSNGFFKTDTDQNIHLIIEIPSSHVDIPGSSRSHVTIKVSQYAQCYAAIPTCSTQQGFSVSISIHLTYNRQILSSYLAALGAKRPKVTGDYKSHQHVIFMEKTSLSLKFFLPFCFVLGFSFLSFNFFWWWSVWSRVERLK